MSKKVKKQQWVIVLGAPIFGNDPRLSLRAPLAEWKLYWDIWAETADPKRLTQELAMEYCAIALTLKHMGVPFRIALGRTDLVIPDFLQALREDGFKFLELPAHLDPHALLFPRDIAVCLGPITLINSDLDKPLLGERWATGQLILSPLGEGGRIHIRRDVALVPNIIGLKSGWNLVDPMSFTGPLVKRGFRVGLLPHNVFRELDPANDLSGYVPEIHVDRTSAFIEDQQGKLHLIVAPGVQSGFTGITTPPQLTAEQTLECYKRVCDQLGINLHVPSKIAVPGSLNLVQFRDKRVLMTNGDEEVYGLVCGLVGDKNVFRTPIPIRRYPVQSTGGVRCLIGELPLWISAGAWKRRFSTGSERVAR